MEVSTASEKDRAGGPMWRALAVLLFVALAFGSLTMFLVMSDVGDTKLCSDVSTNDVIADPAGECFSGSGTQKTITLILGYPSAVVAAIAGLLALAHAITGRARRAMLLLTGAAILLGALSIGIGSV